MAKVAVRDVFWFLHQLEKKNEIDKQNSHRNGKRRKHLESLTELAHIYERAAGVIQPVLRRKASTCNRHARSPRRFSSITSRFAGVNDAYVLPASRTVMR
jgi:hypothetical protein